METHFFEHEIHVFIYNYESEKPSYLLVKPPPLQESYWGPLRSRIAEDETILKCLQKTTEYAIGMSYDDCFRDLKIVNKTTYGDTTVAEWMYAYEVIDFKEIFLNPNFDCLWGEFELVTEFTEFQQDKKALYKLHSELINDEIG